MIALFLSGIIGGLVVLVFGTNIMYWRARARMTSGGEKIGAFSYGDPCEPRSAM
jgi:hypothetical protein